MAHSLQHATHVVSGKSTFPPGSKVMIVKYKMGFSFAHERASIRLVLKAPVLPMLAGTQPFQTATPIFGAWRSLVARCNGVAKVAGSNPVAPTKEHSKNRRFRINPSGVFCCLE